METKVIKQADRTVVETGTLMTVFAGHNDEAAAQIASLHSHILKLSADSRAIGRESEWKMVFLRVATGFCSLIRRDPRYKNVPHIAEFDNLVAAYSSGGEVPSWGRCRRER